MNHTELIKISFKAEAGRDPALLSSAADSRSGLMSQIATTRGHVSTDRTHPEHGKWGNRVANGGIMRRSDLMAKNTQVHISGEPSPMGAYFQV